MDWILWVGHGCVDTTPNCINQCLLGALVRGSGTNSEKDHTGTGNVLSEEEIIGNAFVFILAGHETA